MALHGSSFCLNGNVSLREFDCLPCWCNYSFGMLHHLSSLSSRECKSIVAKTFGTGHKIRYLPGDGGFKLQAERSISSVQVYGLRSLRPCNAKRDDSKDSSILDAQTLKRDLDIAIAEEKYAKAAQIRDTLKLLEEDSSKGVLAANAQFYESFRIGNLAAMQALWAKRKEVCCLLLGVRPMLGYEEVMTSWEHVWAKTEFPQVIGLKAVNAYVRGDVGYVSCAEWVNPKEGSNWGTHFATNVFERIDGKWVICIHHASFYDL